MPHDLAYYVVERELDLPDDFWGSAADGAALAGMTILAPACLLPTAGGCCALV